MAQKLQPHLPQLLTIISSWKLNKALLASKMPMNAYTFKMKLLQKPNYTFTEAEINRLSEVLQELQHEIEKTCGISFNKALAKIVRKKV